MTKKQNAAGTPTFDQATIDQLKDCCKDPDCCKFVENEFKTAGVSAPNLGAVGAIDWIALLGFLPFLLDAIQKWRQQNP